MSAIHAVEPLPAGVGSLRDYEALARARLSAAAWAYFHDAAGDGVTRRANRAAWEALSLLPRVLRGVDAPRLSTQFLGRTWPSPLLVAPMALQRLAHDDAETGMALAAAAQGTGMVVSTQSSTPMESIANAVRGEAGRGPLWFQLYLLKERAATLELVRRAEAAGYEALVLTVDAGVRAARPLQLPAAIRAVHLDRFAGFAAAPGWDDIAWLQAHTRLPVLLKGVLHPADAREALRLRLAGLVVSNHGGRVLDGAAATAAALPAIADVVGTELPLLVDGGISRGTDVLKALALGAQAVLVGRPVLWGLAAAGAAGAAHVLRLLLDEFRLALAQCGVPAAGAATPDLLLNSALDLSQPSGK